MGIKLGSMCFLRLLPNPFNEYLQSQAKLHYREDIEFRNSIPHDFYLNAH